MLDECYQCDKVCPYTQPEGTGNNSDVWLLSELLFTLIAGEWFHSYPYTHSLFCMRQEGYQCDQVSLNTHTEGIGNNAVEWILPELLFTLRAGEWFSFALL